MPTIAALADRYWETYLDSQPTFGTLVGDHRRDAELEDLSDEGLSDHMARLRRLRAEIPADDTDISTSLLAAVIEWDLAEYETEIVVAPVDAYLGPHSRLLIRAAQSAATEPSHARDLAARYAQIPRLLSQASARHRRHVEEDRPPAAVGVRRVLDQLDAYLASDLATDPFTSLRLPDDWSGADAWRSAMEATVIAAIRPAFAAYRQTLETHVLPFARDDAHVGICHLPEGPETYRRLVQRFVTVPQDPTDIHHIGLEHTTETLVDEYAAIGSEAFGTPNVPSILERLRTDPSLRYETAEEMLAHAEEIVERAWNAIDGWLGARPDGPCRVLPVPSALAKDMPPAYYMMPAPDGSRPGTYYLNTHEPKSRDRFVAEAVAFHEAIPGHHFDRALAGQLTHLPAFRRLISYNVHAEGWGLYSERLADEMGLYSGPIDRLGMLSADSWRAGRLVVDTGMHQHGWSRGQAVDFLRTWTAINYPTIEQEVDRYIGWPGQALSYKMGHLEIARLRRRAEKELGERFDLVAFHDTVLTSGGLTLPVLGRLVESWIAGHR